MRFKIDWASLIVGSKFTVFALFHSVFEGNFLSTSPRGAYIWRGDLTEGFCVTVLGGLYLEGLIPGGVYFRNFTVFLINSSQLRWLNIVLRAVSGNSCDGACFELHKQTWQEWYTNDDFTKSTH